MIPIKRHYSCTNLNMTFEINEKSFLFVSPVKDQKSIANICVGILKFTKKPTHTTKLPQEKIMYRIFDS